MSHHSSPLSCSCSAACAFFDGGVSPHGGSSLLTSFSHPGPLGGFNRTFGLHFSSPSKSRAFISSPILPNCCVLKSSHTPRAGGLPGASPIIRPTSTFSVSGFLCRPKLTFG